MKTIWLYPSLYYPSFVVVGGDFFLFFFFSDSDSNNNNNNNKQTNKKQMQKPTFGKDLFPFLTINRVYYGRSWTKWVLLYLMIHWQ